MNGYRWRSIREGKRAAKGLAWGTRAIAPFQSDCHGYQMLKMKKKCTETARKYFTIVL